MVNLAPTQTQMSFCVHGILITWTQEWVAPISRYNPTIPLFPIDKNIRSGYKKIVIFATTFRAFYSHSCKSDILPSVIKLAARLRHFINDESYLILSRNSYTLGGYFILWKLKEWVRIRSPTLYPTELRAHIPIYRLYYILF